MDFGRALRVTRAARGISQQELAERSGVSASYISLIESGKREPTIGSMRKLAEALHIPLDLMMLLAIDSGEHAAGGRDALNRLGETLLATLTANPPAQAHGS